MALIKRGSVWHWRETIRGRIQARSTKTDDKKLAEQMVAQWKAELLQQLVVKGSAPVQVHTAIKAFLNARKGTPGHGSATLHMCHFMKSRWTSCMKSSSNEKRQEQPTTR